jgi:alcohol dehydrogenase class IV
MVKVFSTTPRIIMGAGSSKTIGAELRSRGTERVIVVTDKGVIAAGILQSVEDSLREAKIEYAIFDKVEPDPRYEIVSDCVECAKEARVEMLIGIGGGSPMDITKTASIMLTNKGPIGKYFGVNLIPRQGLPTVLVPTTAGTGSEVTPIAILSDEGEKLKKGIVSPYLYPSMAIIDPELTLGLPTHVTAATGVDALIHAIEAFTSIHATSITDMFCVRAMELLHRNIRIAYAKGDAIEARTAMMEGALMAGIGFANAGVTAVHAFAYPIGAEFHIPHGVANALMLPHVMRFNVLGNLERFARIAVPFGIPTAGLDEIRIVDKVIEAIDRLIDDIRLPRHLSDFGIKEDDIPILAEGALKSTRLLANNPRTLTIADAKQIYGAAL